MVNFDRGDLDHRTHDGHRRQIAHLDFGIDLEHRRELELVLGHVLLGLDARIAGHAQILCPDRIVETRLHGVRDHVRAHLRPVLLGDHLERYLAGPKPRDLRRLGQLRETLVDLAFDLRLRHGDMQSPLELAQCLQGHLHTLRFLAMVRRCLAHGALVRKERLELSRLSAPAPKAGASTNSATFAPGFAKQISIAQTSSPRHEAPWHAEGWRARLGVRFGAGIREIRVCRALRELSGRLPARPRVPAGCGRGDLPLRARRGRHRRRRH